MTRKQNRPRGRRPGAQSLEAANQDKGLGILLCHRCGRKIRDHTRLVCDLPLTKKRITELAQAEAAQTKARFYK
jgi:hypothetical protein